jgi:transposase InsO family protein
MFQLLHRDLWTSPITSVSGHKYYLVILDDYSHYLWTFPLRLKSDTFSTLSNFFAYVHTQFGVPIQGLQSDNGREFGNLSARSFFASHGVIFRMSCPYTSPQNDKAEHIIRTINNVVRSLLFHASVPPRFWPLPLVWQLTSSTFFPLKPSLSSHPTSPFSEFTPPTSIYGFLGANVIPTSPPQPLTNSPLACNTLTITSLN